MNLVFIIRRMKKCCFAICLLLSLGISVQAQIITTIAGGTIGDGNPATNAELNHPLGVAVGKHDNIYIADTYNQVIRKIDNHGTISTFAGGGNISPYIDDGVQATMATLMYPYNVAVDRIGNVYIADALNQRICKVDTNGVFVTIAGNRTMGYSGDGGHATAAQLWNPNGVAVDSIGNVFIADTYNQRIRKVNTSGMISTIAGNGFGAGTSGIGSYSGDGGAATAAELNLPNNIAIDNHGNVFIADQHNYRIRKINSAGIIRTIAGTDSAGYSGDSGPATLARLNSPYGLVTDRDGNVYFSDTYNERIREIDTDGIISTIAGNGTVGFSGDGGVATAAALYQPSGISIDDHGNIYVADFNNSRIRKIDSSHIISTVAGNGVALATVNLSHPIGVAVDTNGNVYIADTYHSAIKKVKNNGVISTIAGTGAAGNSGDGGAATAAKLNSPYGVAVDGNGNVYVVDYMNNCIRKIDSNGIISLFAGNRTIGYSGDNGPACTAETYYPFVACDGKGNVYFSDGGNQRVRKVDSNGIITTVVGNGIAGFSGDGGPATDAELNGPCGICFDPSGNLFIADCNNKRIRKVDNSGVISTILGIIYYAGFFEVPTSRLSNPLGVAVDANDNIYVVQGEDNDVVKISSTGVIDTFAGIGSAGYSGDGGNATSAALNLPWGVAIDRCQNIYIADSYNNRIRKVSGVTGGAELCVGSSTAFHDIGTGGFWSSSNTSVAIVNSYTGIVTGVSKGTDTITYAIGANIATSNITIDSVLNPGVITGIHLVCVGDSHTLSESVTGGVWSCPSGIVSVSAGGVITGITEGSGIVEYSVTNICGTSTALFPIDVVTSSVCSPLITTNIQQHISGLEVYPNPNEGLFTIEGAMGYNMRIYDLIGKLWMQQSRLERSAVIDISVLPKGVYFIEFLDREAGIKVMEKVIKR